MVAAPVVAVYISPTWASRRSDAVFDWTLRHRRILLTVILIVVGSFVAARGLCSTSPTPDTADSDDQRAAVVVDRWT